MRTVLTGGDVFDGTGAPAARADVAVEGDRIVEVGTGLDGDVAIDATGCTIMPGLIDAHVHVMFSGMDPLALASEPFSYAFYRTVGQCSGVHAGGEGPRGSAC
ncbi:hypothetical protein [Nonomuraea sp. NPDC049784]|uniref:hypothetical protein n=1 Tax=Nonomuraea sp. NPDC049784 TaxID=3154361 RepID=UPI003400C62E